MSRTCRAGTFMPVALRGIASKAGRVRRHRFQDLSRLLHATNLRHCFLRLRRGAASGVDRVTVGAYGRDLAANTEGLEARLRQGRYRPQPVRRHLIAKAGGGFRPLGIPAVEDKLVQVAVKQMLEAIWEGEFHAGSWGYRPDRGARKALAELTRELQFGCYGYVVEVDIQGFFDAIDHGWLLRMLAERVADRRLLRLIESWLRAGVLLETGEIFDPARGTPQGGVISPVLANIYLHYALDLWFEKVVRARCRYRAYLCRYADDVVVAFQNGTEARRFYAEVGERLAKFGLTLSAAKSRLVRFSRFHLGKASQSFTFVGFELRWVVDRHGVARVHRRTERKRLKASLARVGVWCARMRHLPVGRLVAELNLKLRGYDGYYGVIGNSRSLLEFHREAARLLCKWLRRRSQKSRLTWSRFWSDIRRLGLASPRITEHTHRQLPMRATT